MTSWYDASFPDSEGKFVRVILLYLRFEHVILSRLALILNPTVVPVMWNIYDGIGRFQTASCMRDDNVHFCSTNFRLALHIGQFHGAICVFMDNVNALAWNPTVVPMMVSVLDRMLEKQEGVSVWPILRGGS